MICAECGCDVRNGVRVITCQTGGNCCCDTLPKKASPNDASIPTAL